MPQFPYAEVAVDAPVRDVRTFTYSVPQGMSVSPGQMVQVPFGPRMADGVIFRLSRSTDIDPIRPINASDPAGALLSREQLDLAAWIAEYYMASLYSAIGLMLPPGFRNRTKAYLEKPEEEALQELDGEFATRLLGQFKGRSGLVQESLLRRALGVEDRRVLDRLVSRGVVRRTWKWRGSKITGSGAATSSEPSQAPEPFLIPSPHQAEALENINAAISQGRHEAFLLQGVTGSGKTEVYLQALARCLEGGRKAILLVPEISLTPQMLQRFRARFPGRVAVIHSLLSQAEHRRMWWGVHQGQFDVVIGSRSALFAPLKPLGLVVLDEEHEWTYKQQDPEPRYHSRTVAMRMAQASKAVLVLGSATPDVVTYHRALTGRRLRLLQMPHRIGLSSSMAGVRIVDMSQELRDGNRSIFSRALQEGLRHVIYEGNQAILFLNRRGAAGIVQCRDCGHVMRCRSCDTPLTYHTSPERLVCHQCNRRSRTVARCPNCRHNRIRHLGLGTQTVVKELEALFPGVSSLRWDRDAADETGHEAILERFAGGEAQVLVGTQMVARGLHIPSVTLVGAVLADIGLHLPDFRAGERIFQLLCQVAGRAGRGPGEGTVLVQTYSPHYYSVVLASRQDYASFYEQEAVFRRVQRMPPYARLLRLIYTHVNPGRSQREAERLGRLLRKERSDWAMTEVDVLGPAPAYNSRVRGRYRWHILLRGQEPRQLLDKVLGKVALKDGWVVDVDPVTVL